MTILAILFVKHRAKSIFSDNSSNFKSKAVEFLREAFEALKLETFTSVRGVSSRDVIVTAHVALADVISRLVESLDMEQPGDKALYVVSRCPE